jgi:hypothetical protein
MPVTVPKNLNFPGQYRYNFVNILYRIYEKQKNR